MLFNNGDAEGRIKRFPVLTCALIIVHVVITFFVAASHWNGVPSLLGYDTYPAFRETPLYGATALYVDRILISVFYYGNIFLLIFDMFALWVVADNLENTAGRIVTALSYLIIGSACALIFFPNAPFFASTGALEAAFGMFVVLHPKSTVRIFHVHYHSSGTKLIPVFILVGYFAFRHAIFFAGRSEAPQIAAMHAAGFVVGTLAGVSIRFFATRRESESFDIEESRIRGRAALDKPLEFPPATGIEEVAKIRDNGADLSLKMTRPAGEGLYALLSRKDGAELIESARAIAKTLNIPLAEATRRLRRHPGFVSSNLHKDVCDALADKLSSVGLKTIAIPMDSLLDLPPLKESLSIDFADDGFDFLMPGGVCVRVPRDKIFLACAARVEQTITEPPAHSNVGHTEIDDARLGVAIAAGYPLAGTSTVKVTGPLMSNKEFRATVIDVLVSEPWLRIRLSSDTYQCRSLGQDWSGGGRVFSHIAKLIKTSIDGVKTNRGLLDLAKGRPAPRLKFSRLTDFDGYLGWAIQLVHWEYDLS
ncbi:MAG: rhomboid family intramembrane serine protease [Planctomycetes bacterium]|nr:rhomboid family intramembrane serine protease [Planctomycetota bacterium]